MQRVFVELTGKGALQASKETLARGLAGTQAQENADAERSAITQTSKSVVTAAQAVDPAAEQLFQVSNAVAGIGLRASTDALRALAARPAELLQTVQRIREIGWGLALDDVGADSMSLSFMPLLRPDVVKLDLRLVQERPGPEIAEIMNAVNAHAERTEHGQRAMRHIEAAVPIDLGVGLHLDVERTLNVALVLEVEACLLVALAGAPPARQAHQHRVEHIAFGVERRLLGQVHYARLAPDRHRARVGHLFAGQYLGQCALARAATAEQGHHLAPADPQVDTVEDRLVTEGAQDPGGGDHRCVGGLPRVAAATLQSGPASPAEGALWLHPSYGELLVPALAPLRVQVIAYTHFDPPADAKAYLHRSGRTARAGESGAVVTITTPRQVDEIVRMQSRAGVQARHHDSRTTARPMTRQTLATSGTAAPTTQPRRGGSGSGYQGRGGGYQGNRSGGYQGRSAGPRSGGYRGGRDERPSYSRDEHRRRAAR